MSRGDKEGMTLLLIRAASRSPPSPESQQIRLGFDVFFFFSSSFFLLRSLFFLTDVRLLVDNKSNTSDGPLVRNAAPPVPSTAAAPCTAPLFFPEPPAPPSPSLFLFYSFSSSSSVCLSAPCFAPGIASMGAEAGSRTYLLLLLTARPRALPARASDHVRASVEPPTFPHQTIDHPASLFTHLLSLLLSPLLPSPVWAAAFATIATLAGSRVSTAQYSLRPALRSSTRLC